MDVILIILLSEAWVFKAGTNQDGWFSADNLLDQVENAIDIFEAKTNNFVTGLFMFDNASSHQKRAPDALSARKMLKNPNQRWMNMKGGPRMWNGWYMNGSDKISQDFYFPNDHPEFPGWFKGMENIICEHGLWPNEGLKA